jgi:DNA polymerase-3 subunit alpha
VLDEIERQGEKSVAITDHGSCIKLFEFYKKAKERNINPILGCEFYCGERDDKNYYHLVLLAKNEIGLKNIFNLMYKAHNNFYYKPRIQYKDLEEHKEGIICLSACLGGELPKKIIAKDKDGAIKVANYFKSLFGDDYYLEIQPNSIPIQSTVNKEIEKICELGFNPVVTCDAHYVTKEDYNAHDTMLCIQVNKKKDDEKRFRFTSNDFYLKSSETVMKELDYLSTEFVANAIKNTYEIAEKCNVVIDTSRDLLPKMPGVKNESLELAELCNKGFQERLKEGHYDGMDLKEVTDRITYELQNIIEKGYPGYFLIVEDFLRWCDENDIPTGIGRGSVCGSEVAFVLRITEVEPIKYGLLYERFLNPTRNSPPDVDSDICYEKRPLLIDYIKGRYGEENVSHIIAEGKMTIKAVIRKVLTAYGYDMKAINATCKLVDKRAEDLTDALSKSEELRRRLLGKDELKDMLILEGLMSHASMHAAGLLITPEPVYNLYPTRINRDENVLVSEWHKKHIEATGGYKFDILGLKQLTIFNKTVQAINRNHGTNYKVKDFFHIDLKDPKIYEVLNKGLLRSIFQFTGETASAVINEMKPTTFDDIMVAESICRPGVKEADLYLSNKKLFNETGVFPVPEYYRFVSHILDETMGAIVYQEQTMRILNEIGGFTLGEADTLRKVKSLEPYRERFVTNAVKVGLTVKEANDLFDRFDLG